MFYHDKLFCDLPTISVTGWLYDWSEYYPGSLFLGGATVIISSIVMVYSWLRTGRNKDYLKDETQLPVDDKFLKVVCGKKVQNTYYYIHVYSIILYDLY